MRIYVVTFWALYNPKFSFPQKMAANLKKNVLSKNI
jgi:hypothetical protein